MADDTTPTDDAVDEAPPRSDTGPFAIVPEWLLDLDVTDKAVRLYAVLARYADADGLSWPSRTTLARRLRCSVDTVDRAATALIEAGALVKEQRTGDDGERQTSNLWTILRVRPPGRKSAAHPGRTDAAQNESQEKREPTTGGRKSRTTPEADAVTREWWEATEPRPVAVSFVAARSIVDAALKAGWSREQVLRALPHAQPLAKWRLEQTLARHRQADEARADAPGPAVSTGEQGAWFDE